MKNKTYMMRLFSAIICLIMVIGITPLTVHAASTSVPGAEGHVLTDICTGTFELGYDSTIIVYATPNAYSSMQYRIIDEGGFFAIPSYDNTQWYFDGWRTWYKGSHSGAGLKKSDKANPVYDDNTYYYTVSSNGFWNDGKLYPAGSMTVLKERLWKGTYYLSAIFKPILTVNAGEGITYTVSSSGSNKISDGKYGIKYQNGATISYQVSDAYTVTGASASGATYSTQTGSVTLNEVIRPTSVTIGTRLKQQKVQFNGNDGSGTMAEQTFVYGTAQTLTANAFARDGYTFAGWNTKADGSGTAYTDRQSLTFKPATDGECVTLYAQWEPVVGTVGGTVTSGRDTAGTTTLELWSEGADAAAYTVTTDNDSYTMENVAVGSYNLVVSKKNHVTRTYAVTSQDGTVTQDVKICLLGDVTEDGQINIGDAAKVYAHVKGTAVLTDSYVLECANANGGSLNIGDVGAIYAHVKGTRLLF